MTLDECRIVIASYRRAADDEAKSLKDPNVALEKLRLLYRKFDAGDRRMADEVFSEWALSDDEKIRFDALFLIDELKISIALPALHKLATRLAISAEPGAPYELKKVQRIISGLGVSSKPR
jgi:hypothetical protein